MLYNKRESYYGEARGVSWDVKNYLGIWQEI